MLRYLFPRLTPAPSRGAELFEALVAEARQPHWFVDSEVPDTIDGRFAVLSTVIALATVRLERGGESGRASAVALTERFVDAMDSEHRQLGIGDPTVGKTVRKLVGALSRRVDLWREAVERGASWSATVNDSLFRRAAPSPSALDHAERKLRNLWGRLEGAPDDAVAQGRFG